MKGIKGDSDIAIGNTFSKQDVMFNVDLKGEKADGNFPNEVIVEKGTVITAFAIPHLPKNKPKIRY